MPDIVDPADGTYVDMLTVVYRAVESPGSAHPDATVVLLVDGGVSLDRDALRHEIERLHFGRDARGEPWHQPYILDERYTHTSWGADGATLEFIVQAASYAVAGIVGGAAWDGLKSIAKRIGASRGLTSNTHALDEQSALRRATEMAIASFNDIKRAELTPLSVHLTGNKATVVLLAADGSTLTAEPSLIDGGALGPITRAYKVPSV